MGEGRRWWLMVLEFLYTSLCAYACFIFLSGHSEQIQVINNELRRK